MIKWERTSIPSAFRRGTTLPKTYWKGYWSTGARYAVYRDKKSFVTLILYKNGEHVRSDGTETKRPIFFRSARAAKRACEEHDVPAKWQAGDFWN